LVLAAIDSGSNSDLEDRGQLVVIRILDWGLETLILLSWVLEMVFGDLAMLAAWDTLEILLTLALLAILENLEILDILDVLKTLLASQTLETFHILDSLGL
jgi:hypothetical protein